MSDVVSVALITGLSTAAVGIVSAVLGVLAERYRSHGETERLKARLDVEDARLRAEAIRETRRQVVTRLRRWIEHQLVLAADVNALIAAAPISPVDLSPLIQERLNILRTTPPQEASINTILSQFSDAEIITDVRQLEKLNRELKLMFNQPELVASIAQRRFDEFAKLWEPVVAKEVELDKALAGVNARLEKYIVAAEA